MRKLGAWTAFLVVVGVTTASSSAAEDRTAATTPTTASSGGQKPGDGELRVIGRNLRFDVEELSAKAGIRKDQPLTQIQVAPGHVGHR